MFAELYMVQSWRANTVGPHNQLSVSMGRITAWVDLAICLCCVVSAFVVLSRRHAHAATNEQKQRNETETWLVGGLACLLLACGVANLVATYASKRYATFWG